jgi:hypothetical protein
MTTKTLVQHFKCAGFSVLSLTVALVIHPQNAFATLTLEFEALHLLPPLLIQRLEFFLCLHSAHGTSHVIWFSVKSFLFLDAKYFLALAAHYRVRGER